MKKTLTTLLLGASLYAAAQQKLPARWDELTASDFPAALQQSSRTCVLPIGILEKHGPHSPLGTDLIHVREIAARATKNEYAVVFPDYFYGQINEARQQYGTFALPSTLIYNLLEATCDEIARNGFNKIVILNGHGGNPEFLRFFMQSLLGKRHNYAVYLVDPDNDPAYNQQIASVRKSDAGNDLHAGEHETSLLLYLRPDLMQMDKAASQSGANQQRLKLPNLYTPIWWYASYPNHYAGDGAAATPTMGKLMAEHEVKLFADIIKTVKADQQTLKLQEEYYNKVEAVGKN
ncbi:creatininase family protein [Mucilaginibacter sp.]